jgi:lysophospholipase L1-like esterase
MSYISRALLAKRPKLRFVAAGGRIPETNLAAPTAAKLRAVSRVPIKFAGRIRRFRLAFDNWYFSATGGKTDAPTTYTINKVAVEIDGETQPLYFAGARSVTIAAGAERSLTDWIRSAAWGLPFIPRNQKAWVRVEVTLPSDTGRFPVGCTVSYSGVEGDAFFAVYDPANEIDQVDDTGDMAAPTGASLAADFAAVGNGSANNNMGFGPSAIIGEALERNLVSLIAITDSIGSGREDTRSPAPVFLGWGHVDRAFDDDNGPAIMHASRTGARAVAMAANDAIAPYMRYATHSYIELGTNDINADAADAVTVEAALSSIYTTARNAGAWRLIASDILPLNASTDDFATNATYNASGIVLEVRAVRAWLQGLLDSSAIQLFLPYPGVRAASDNDRWLTNGTPQYMTTDGIHPSPVGHDLNGVELRYGLDTAITLPLASKRYAMGCTTKPNSTALAKVEAFFAALAAAGVTMEAGWWLGGPSDQACRVNLVAPGTYSLGQSGTVTYNNGVDIQGNGSDGALSCVISPSVFAVASQDSLALVWKSTVNVADDDADIGSPSGTSGFRTIRLNPRTAAGKFEFRLNDTTNTSLDNSDRRGTFIANRSGSTKTAYRNKTLLGTATVASTSMPAAPIVIFRDVTTAAFSSGGGSFFGIFPDLTGKIDAVTDAVDALTA